MAQLSEAQKDKLHAELMRYLSSGWIPCDLSKSQLRMLLDYFDAGLETAESSILNSVPAIGKTWLLNNVSLARHILEKVAQERTEVLA